jgi:rhodanese-related sulfurtransferase
MAHVPGEGEGLPLDVEIVVVCRSGGRSQKVAEFLRASGHGAVNLDGGMRAWAAAGLPVITDTGVPGSVI